LGQVAGRGPFGDRSPMTWIAALMVLVLAACSEPDLQSVRGTADAGKPRDAGMSDAGKPRDAGMSMEAGMRADANPDPSADAGPLSACAPCGDQELCVPEVKECVNFCETPDEVPGAGERFDLIVCGGDVKDLGTNEKWVLDLAQSCTNTCLLVCRWQNWFCEAEIDCAAECAKSYVQDKCDADCGAEANDPARVACQNAKCVDARKQTCVEDSARCPDGKVTPKCEDFSCANECGAGTPDDNNLFDGYCDDGAYAGSSTDFCPFGTDCADCGPREGKARPVDTDRIEFGNPCPNSWRCPGHSADHDLNESWCIDVIAGVARCLVDCSSVGETCAAADYECIELKDSSGGPLQDSNGREARVCVPTSQDLCI